MYNSKKEVKDSCDIILNYNDTVLDSYTEQLQKCLLIMRNVIKVYTA